MELITAKTFEIAEAELMAEHVQGEKQKYAQSLSIRLERF